MERRSTPTTISGARAGAPTRLRRLVARAMARDLPAFVVPDVRFAHASGLNPETAGLRPVSTPRHASVLLLVGDIPEGMMRAATIVYAQIPRPRTILAAGGGHSGVLPPPDISVPLDQAALTVGVEHLRALLAEGAFNTETATFEIVAARTRTEFLCPMHPEIVRNAPGSCPLCGMDLVPQEVVATTTGHGHMVPTMDHKAMAIERAEAAEYSCPMHPESVRTEPGTCPICGMNLVPKQLGRVYGPLADSMDQDAPRAPQMPELAHDSHSAPPDAPRSHNIDISELSTHEGHNVAMPDEIAMDHDGMDHGKMDHSGHMRGGFMSMIAMTKDLPRSRDGLPMEWAEVPFGPLFPGLPAGLDLTLTLDGDTVARAVSTPGAAHRGLEATWLGSATTFPDRLARLDPLAPMAYRVLARRALEAAAGVDVANPSARGRVGALERERAVSHLSWLSQFGALLGDQALARRAATLQLVLLRVNEINEVVRRGADIRTFLRAVERTPLMRRRLIGIGKLSAAPETMCGPVARALGIAVDERTADPIYGELGFAPIVREGGDALARLRVRLAEIGQSIALALSAGAITSPIPALPPDLTGIGSAVIETPRGSALLRVELDAGQVVGVRLEDRPRRHASLIPAVANGAELADALVGVSSLDLSPWEIDR